MSNFAKAVVNAPKDPLQQRNFFYAAADTVIYASDRGDGLYQDLVFLGHGLLAKKASSMGGITDESLLELLTSSEGFFEAVHSIGITVESEETEQVTAIFQMTSKSKGFFGNTVLECDISCDGTEHILDLRGYQIGEDDNGPGNFIFRFKEAGRSAKASIRFFLNDGFESPNIGIDPPVDFTSENYRQMIAKSLLHMGNVTRIQNLINKARAGEEVTVAYIGGSITGGAGAKPNTESYTYKSYKAIKKLCGENSRVNYIKAGVGGTPSEFGIIRYEHDVLKDNTVLPDLVVVEFAVNDADDETKGDCYESLVYRILQAANKPAVILLFAVFENDWNLQDRLACVGYNYDIPMVSVKDAVVDQFKLTRDNGNVITKRQFFYDIYHPTNDGHTIMADCITYLIEQAMYENPSENDIDLCKAPAIGRSFVDIRQVDRAHNTDLLEIKEGSFIGIDKELQLADFDADTFFTPILPDNWMHDPEKGNEPLSIKVKCKAFIMVFKDSGSSEFGKASVSVDSKEFAILDPKKIGWTHCHPVILVNEAESDWHEISIRMEDGEEMKKFTVLCFGIVF